MPNDLKEMLIKHGSFYLKPPYADEYELLDFESINDLIEQINGEYLESWKSEDDGSSPELTKDIYLLKHSIPVFLTSEFLS